LLASLAATLIFSFVYHIIDIAPYFLLALPAAGVGWIVAMGGLIEKIRRREGAFMTRPIAPFLPALMALAALLFHYTWVDKSWDTSAADYGRGIMEHIPQGALVLTHGDNDTHALWYQQMCLGRRPDVSIFGAQFIFQGWYARYFESAGRPRITVATEDRLPGYKIDSDVALAWGVLLPNFKEGRRIFATQTARRDLIYDRFFSPTPYIGGLLSEQYYEVTQYPFPAGLPGPVLYELMPNPELAAMSRREIYNAFLEFYHEMARQGRARVGDLTLK
jgi:hypothetical protein